MRSTISVLFAALIAACVPPPGPCATNKNCDRGEVCVSGSCVAATPDNPGTPDDAPGLNDAGIEDMTNDSGVASIPCANDDECGAPASICNNGECVPGCGERIGAECAGGTVCDRGTGRCVSVTGPCTVDGDCGPPDSVCESGQCIPGCGQAAGVQCTGAQTCDASTGRCQGEQLCIGDVREENDTLATARGIGPGSLLGLSACPGDDDYYVMTLPTGYSLSATAAFSGGEGNLDLELYDTAGTLLASARSTGANETLAFTALAAGPHVLRVFLAEDLGASPGSTYDLDLAITGSSCAEDAFEDNDDPIFGFPIAPALLPNLHACPGDEDYYLVSLETGAELSVTMVSDPAEGALSLELTDIFGFPIAASTRTGPGRETLTFTADLADFYSIHAWLVQEAGTVPGNTYSLDIAMGSAPAACSDAFEENDTRATAQPIGAGRVANLSVCTQDDDYYSVNLVAGDVVDVSLAFTHAEGDIDVSLLDPLGFEVAISESASDAESFTYTAVSTGAHTIRVYLYSDLGFSPGNSYELNIR